MGADTTYFPHFSELISRKLMVNDHEGFRDF